MVAALQATTVSQINFICVLAGFSVISICARVQLSGWPLNQTFTKMEISKDCIIAIAEAVKNMLSAECMILSENEAREYKRYQKLVKKEYISGSDAAKLLGVKPATITRKRQAGLIPAELRNGKWVYPINALLKA